MKWELVMNIEFKRQSYINFDELKINSLFILSTDPIFIFIKYSSDRAAILRDDSIDFNNGFREFIGSLVIPVKITDMKIENYKE